MSPQLWPGDGRITETLTDAFVPAAGWAITGQQLFLKGGMATAWIAVERTGANITVPASGNIANTPVAETPNPVHRPSMRVPIALMSAGPLIGGECNGAGQWRFNAIAPGNTINTGNSFEFGATWSV